MKTLPYDKAKMEQIIKKYPTPFHIYDEAGIISAAHNLQRAFQWNVGYKEYYAVKACPNPAILKLLHRNGCGMDCSSETELMLCEKLGITGEDIMFSSNDTPAREFEYARTLGAIVNLDEFSHLDFRAAFRRPSACAIIPAGISNSATPSWETPAMRNTA